MDIRHDGVYINNRKPFSAIGRLKSSTVETTLQFAYDMTFGNSGEHRDHRTGGTHSRKKGEIFANTFQGKLSEYALYNMLFRDFPDLQPPDIQTYGLGEWDDADFELASKKISVKSTKSFGNLLLLETKDWNNAGQYIPNISKGSADYDFFILIRINPYCEDILKRNRLLYTNSIDYSTLSNILLPELWSYDIPGFVTKEQLMYAINNNHIINQGTMLNGNTRMDAENYYIQSGDMINLQQLKDYLRR